MVVAMVGDMCVGGSLGDGDDGGGNGSCAWCWRGVKFGAVVRRVYGWRVSVVVGDVRFWGQCTRG